MKYWIVKSEPNVYSIDLLEKDKITIWDGIRNYQARNNLKAMEKDDFVLVYHSGDDKSLVGISQVIRPDLLDPKNGEWAAVELKFVKWLTSPISLSEIREDKILSQTGLVKQSRLSVIPITEEQYTHVLKLSKTH